MSVLSVLRLFLAFLPAPAQVFVLGVIAIILVVIVFKAIALVLDSIPFL